MTSKTMQAFLAHNNQESLWHKTHGEHRMSVRKVNYPHHFHPTYLLNVFLSDYQAKKSKNNIYQEKCRTQ